ncbi:carbohydrate ABC transporter permease [Micromonospora vinacea]|uniref:Multiple sugar transport system permease protein n=1 Tax=Micromonospora vinacea TaxID=709878 RepID=A0ABS0KAK1_9ACTN|nr:sugar ABC transporter permease [Micromonospora vinacea]MBG6105505.1 multiple sugar transport system permease protein [Micromonospora vinacea]WSZ78324.1 sugar ABC transporter permease [Micromonospora sp. NBC_00860]WTA65247.1 sugar ABC transporter permease [Micromonospora sp. NBC_00855]
MTVVEQTGAPKTTPPGRPRRRPSPLGSKWTPYLFLAPAALFILVFQAVPLVQEVYLSFTRTRLLNPTRSEWVGLENFNRIFGDPEFHRTLLITVVYVITCVVVAIGAGLVVALLLNRKFRGRGVARALVTVPWAAPGIAVALIATWMLNAQYGIVNRFLDAVGLGVPGGAILDSPRYALPAVLATTIWQLFPFTSVVLLSALQSVPQDLNEAATVDGAGRWATFRAVTWQVIKPTVGLLALLMTIWSLRRFELIWLMTKGGPVGATETLVIDLYSQAFDSKELGSAAAIGMVGVVISLIVIIGSRLVARAVEKGDVR